jgi:L-ascorbate metabolism protein UlaG (beta-lactamase superfamily)
MMADTNKPILKFHGHGCVQLTRGNVSLIVDPFLNDNPQSKIQASDIKCQYVLVTHGHFDHCADAAQIVDNNRALLVGTPEVARYVADQCHNPMVETLGFGAKKTYDFGFIRVTPAWHGSGIAGALPCGFIVGFYDKVVYFAGDTGLFGDMKLLGELENIDYAVLPIGNYFTMGPDDAVLAAEFLKAKTVIPIHYNTWPPIEQNPNEFERKMAAHNNIAVIILEPGAEVELT